MGRRWEKQRSRVRDMDYEKFGVTVRGKKLLIGSVRAEWLARKYGTPLYVIDERRIRANYRAIADAFASAYREGEVRVHYACKANTNLNVLRILWEEGARIDAVSPGEVDACLLAGFDPIDIMFTGTSVSDEELTFLARSGVAVNFDSMSAFKRVTEIAIPELVSFRINPDVGAGHHAHCITGGKDSKFGIWEKEAIAAYKLAKKAGVKRFGIHAHIGSGILESRYFVLEIDKLTAIAGKISREAGINFDFIDFGGGFGVPYRPEQSELDIKRVAREIIARFRKRCGEEGLGTPAFAIEPGRYIVANACALLTRVNTVKITPHRKIAGVDAGFNVLVRPTMYGSYHHILVDGKIGSAASGEWDIAGPICESGDLFARGRALPKVSEGDLLVLLDAGAYGFSMSSRYNSRPLPAEVLVKGARSALIRERENYEDSYARQKKAAWL